MVGWFVQWIGWNQLFVVIVVLGIDYFDFDIMGQLVMLQVVVVDDDVVVCFDQCMVGCYVICIDVYWYVGFLGDQYWFVVV